MSQPSVESLMNDPRWSPFWFLRCCTNIGRKGRKPRPQSWQVWEFESHWYPNGKADRWIVGDADTAIEACQAALATLEPVKKAGKP